MYLIVYPWWWQLSWQRTDIGHRFTCPETGIRAWELNTGPIKTKYCMGRGLNPGPAKYYDRMNCNVQNKVIAWFVTSTNNRNRLMERIHDIHMECVHQTTDNSQTKEQWLDWQMMARPTRNGWWTDHPKNDVEVQKRYVLQNISKNTTSCTKLV